MTRIRKLWFGGATALAVAGAAFAGALTIPTAPAQAQEWFGVHIGPFGFGFGEPYYGPYYHNYYHPYYAPYYNYYYPYEYRWGYPY